ncbi:hypothetical protein F4779DRAFT_601596 [Xylariaceae sp. FL0662B]|nr:hypothetical protein F4779DRAFT_601596 [Xylariaceae sp. FL0662B]
MAQSRDRTDRPLIPHQQSQESVTRKPLSSPTSTTHRRVGSDDFSVISSPHRSLSVSPESRQEQWFPMGAIGPSSPAVARSSAANWSDGGDLGTNRFPASSDRERAQASSSAAPRARPATLQFDNVPIDQYSPAGSSLPFFSPRARSQNNRTDSRANLLNTPSTPWRSPRTPPPYYTATTPRRKKWWHWQPAWWMYVFFLFGILCAVGHHIFYKVLDGQPAEQQIAMLRYGTILAFAAKAALVASVVVAFKQQVWTTVRNKFLSLAAIDSLFAATEDLSSLLNIEIYKRATGATLLAVFIWCTPLVIILTSNTLTVEMALRVDNGTCPGIRTLNFDKEELEDFRSPTKIDHLFGLSVNTWNTTSQDTTSPDWFDYWTAPSEKFTQVATQAVYMEQAIAKTEAHIDICGPGWNCTYTVNFTAPAYKCSEVASGVGSQIKPVGEQKPPSGLSTKLLLPEGNNSYYAFTSGGEYENMQLKDVETGGMPKTKPPFPEDLGVFRTEPIIWVGYSVRANPDEPAPANRSIPGWDDAFVPKVIACEHHEAEYTVRFNLTGGQQFTNITNRKFLHRVIDTTWTQGEYANDGTNDNTTAVPKSNYVYPRDVHHYRRVAAFHSVGWQLRAFINGTLDSRQTDNPIQYTKAIQTKLLDPRHEYFPFADLAERIQSLHEDIVFSLFSNQQFVSVVWAAHPSEISGTVAGNSSTEYPCERSRMENRYAYHERDLWIVYSVAIGLALAGVASGTRALLENEGVLRNTRFSSIVAATRGPALEKLGVFAGFEDRGDLPPDAKKFRVGYGLVPHSDGGAAASRPASGFGFDDVQEEPTPGLPDRGSTLGEAPDVRYGFGLEGDVRQLKDLRRSRSEGSIFRLSRQ